MKRRVIHPERGLLILGQLDADGVEGAGVRDLQAGAVGLVLSTAEVGI